MLVDSPHKTSEITIAQSPTPLERIGYGSCGSVWADTSRYPDIDQCESALVLKRADGLPDRSIESEANTHKHILSCIEASGDLHGSNAFSSSFYINIPSHTAFLNPGAPTWGDILPRLPADSNPCQALVSERILPLPHAVRKLIVERSWYHESISFSTRITLASGYVVMSSAPTWQHGALLTARYLPNN